VEEQMHQGTTPHGLKFPRMRTQTSEFGIIRFVFYLVSSIIYISLVFFLSL